MATKKFKYSINVSTIPLTIPTESGEQEVNGVFSFYKPRSLFCRCGQQYRADERKESEPSWDGFTCTACGHTFSKTDVLYLGWYGKGFIDYQFKPNEICAKAYRYRCKTDPNTNEIILYKELGEPGDDKHYTLDDVKLLLLHPYTLSKILKKYNSRMSDEMRRVMELVVNKEIKFARNFTINPKPGFLRFVCEVYDRNPAILSSVLDELDYNSDNRIVEANLTYDKYEAAYPEYFHPLTSKVIKDARLYRKLRDCSQYSYSHSSQTPMDGLPAQVAPQEAEGLDLVVSYYQSGLISYNQFRTIVAFKKAFANPNFVRVFKANYMQMGTYLYDLSKNKVDLSKADLGIRDYYLEENTKPFIDFGYTADQVYEAMNSCNGDYLDFLIKIGSTRRLKGAMAK